MAVMTMAGLFGEADLRRVAGERSFGRGLGYLDAVGDLETGVEQVTATVYGTDAYEVVLDLDDGGVTGECSCPHGQEGFFCKHLVAVGLTVLGQAGDVPAQRAAAAAKARSLESWLEGLSRDDLLTLVREQVREDRGLRRRLELRAAAAGPDLSDVRARVRELLDVSGFSRYGAIEYADARAYSSQADEVLPVIDGLIDGGQAAEAAGIAGQALSAVLETLEQADDAVPDRRPGLPASRRSAHQNSGLPPATRHISAVRRIPGGTARRSETQTQPDQAPRPARTVTRCFL
jgi:SWIM zinc finger